MSIEYCLGKDLHLTVLLHNKAILAMAKEIQQKRDLRGLERIEDSLALLSFIKHFKKLVKLAPSSLLYSDPRSSDAKRPKRVEVLPERLQSIEAGGFYMFTVKTNTFKRGLFLFLFCIFAVTFCLWKIWPIWMRIYVWHFVYYLSLSLVSA